MFNVLDCRDDLNNLFRMRLPCHKRFLDKAPWRQFADVPCDIRVREQTTKYLQQDIAHAHLYFICFSLLVVAAVPSFLPIHKSDGHVSVTECLEVDSVCWRVIPISCVRDKIHFWLGLYCWLAGAGLHHHQHMSRPPYYYYCNSARNRNKGSVSAAAGTNRTQMECFRFWHREKKKKKKSPERVWREMRSARGYWYPTWMCTAMRTIDRRKIANRPLLHPPFTTTQWGWNLYT